MKTAKILMNFHFLWSTPNAFNALIPVLRPIAISVMISVNPRVTTRIRYVRRKMPPPYFAARYGKRQIFPRPTAAAAAARMNPIRFENRFR